MPNDFSTKLNTVVLNFTLGQFTASPHSIPGHFGLILSMEILFLIFFAATGAFLMNRNGLSWLEGALWGGFLTFFGLIVIVFRIKSHKKKALIIEQSPEEKSSELNYDEKQYVSSMLSQRATKQILFGLAWWIGSFVAMYLALQSTGNTVYWFGGALGAFFHWYRAYKIFAIGKAERLSLFKQNEYILIAVTLVIAFASVGKIVPEYFRIDVPTIGTCWAKTGGDLYTPVACWSSIAEAKTVSFAESAEACGTNSYFQPTSREERYTCLQDL
jgi:hypothetical protein